MLTHWKQNTKKSVRKWLKVYNGVGPTLKITAGVLSSFITSPALNWSKAIFDSPLSATYKFIVITRSFGRAATHYLAGKNTKASRASPSPSPVQQWLPTMALGFSHAFWSMKHEAIWSLILEGKPFSLQVLFFLVYWCLYIDLARGGGLARQRRKLYDVDDYDDDV